MTNDKGVIALSYYTGVPNVGDLANADLISAVGGVPSYQTRNVHLTHLLAVGSVMEWAQPSSIIWGTGVMDPARGVGGVIAKNVFALRGALSLGCLRDHGLTVDVPLGDPAFLLPELLHVLRKSIPGKVGIVPHYVNQHDPFFLEMVRQGAQLLDVKTLSVRSFLEEMSTCQFVISSSLHGLIFAEAFGIPNLWVETGNAVLGDGFKFRDWFSTTEFPQLEPFRPQGMFKLNDVSQKCNTHNSIIDKTALKTAFPKSLLIDMGAEAPDRSTLRVVDICRRAPVHLFIDMSTEFDPEDLKITISSAASQMDQVQFVIVGRHADAVHDLDFPHDIMKYFPEHAGVDATFMKFFYDMWAEPQKHGIVEAGFDFSHIDIVENLDGELLRQPHLEAITLDRNGRRIIYRRPGRWW